MACVATLGPPSTLNSTDVWNAATTQLKLPFTLSGAPVVRPPTSVANLTAPNNIDTLNTQISFITQGLITDQTLCSGTTLRDGNLTYTLKFIAIHTNLWPTGAGGQGTTTDTGVDTSGNQVSLFFTGPQGECYHICVPIVTTGTPNNMFLDAWLNEKTVPSALTVNSLIDVKQNAKCIRLNYTCLSAFGTSYTLVLFRTPIVFNKTLGFLTTPTTVFTAATTRNYTLKTFSDSFNLVMNIKSGGILQFTERFTTATTSVTPSYYFAPSSTLMSTYFRQTSKALPKPAVKCYPINLMKDVREDGSIVVDQTNKPVPADSVKNELTEGGVQKDPGAVDLLHNTVFWVVFSIVALTTLALVVWVIVLVWPDAAARNAAARVSLLQVMRDLAGLGTVGGLRSVPEALLAPPVVAAAAAAAAAPQQQQQQQQQQQLSMFQRALRGLAGFASRYRPWRR